MVGAINASLNSAISAYSRTAKGAIPSLDDAEAPASTSAPSFPQALKEAVSDTIATQRKAESVSTAAAYGRADPTEVVTAITNAEVSLQSVLAVRDKVVSAYQDILKMPI